MSLTKGGVVYAKAVPAIPGRTSGSGLQYGQPKSRPGVSLASSSAGWSLTYSSITSPCEDSFASPKDASNG